MSAFFTFALVVVIVSLILLAFAIANLVYFNQFKSGVALTSNQLRTLKAINIIGMIMIGVLIIYGIFVAVQAQRVSTAVATAAAVKAAAPPAVSAPLVAAPTAPAAAAAAVPVAAVPVAAAPAAAAAAVPVAAVPVAAAAAPMMNSSSLPSGVKYAGKTSDGTMLYSVTQPTQVNAGQYLCVPGNSR